MESVTYCWERGRLVRKTLKSAQGSWITIFALRAQCGRDVRAPSVRIVLPFVRRHNFELRGRVMGEGDSCRRIGNSNPQITLE